MRSGDAREVTVPKSMASVLQPPPSPDLGRGLAEHPEAGVDCEGGGADEVLYRASLGAESAKAIYPPGNSRAALAPSGFTSRSSGPEYRKGSISPTPPLFWCEGFTITAL